MPEEKLIITGGNHDFFPQLEVFVRSLRGAGGYEGKVVICDNTIGGEWNAPQSYADEDSFTDKELSFFSDYDIDVRSFYRLVEDHSISRESIESIQGYTTRYPCKFVRSIFIKNII